MNRRDIATSVAILLALVGIALSVTVDRTDDGQGHKSTKVTFHVDKSGQPGVQTGTLTVPAPAAEKAAAIPDKQMRDETPAMAEQVAPGELTAAQEAATRIKATQPPLPTAGASAGFIGCRTYFVRNQSDRHGVRPQVQVLHYTVTRNLLGWADVLAIVHQFNLTSSQASSTFVIDREGNCAYIVPIERKAWTQAAGNPFSISYEIIDFGNELTYLDPAGYAKLRSVMEQVSARTGIPMRAGAVNGCVPTRSGIVQHKDFGYCGGGHVDITPFNRDAVIRTLTVHQPVPKAVKWLGHRKAIHEAYQHKCKHPYQRERRPVTCKKLRASGHKLDKLLARKTPA